jgi:hypothetical protein
MPRARSVLYELATCDPGRSNGVAASKLMIARARRMHLVYAAAASPSTSPPRSILTHRDRVALLWLSPALLHAADSTHAPDGLIRIACCTPRVVLRLSLSQVQGARTLETALDPGHRCRTGTAISEQFSSTWPIGPLLYKLVVRTWVS